MDAAEERADGFAAVSPERGSLELKPSAVTRSVDSIVRGDGTETLK